MEISAIDINKKYLDLAYATYGGNNFNRSIGFKLLDLTNGESNQVSRLGF